MNKIFKTIYALFHNYGVMKKYAEHPPTSLPGYIRTELQHAKIYRDAKIKYHKKYSGHKDKYGKEIHEGDKVKITDQNGKHIMFVSVFPALYPNQKDAWTIEAIPSESGPGYWYEMDEIPKYLKNEQIEIIN